MRTRITPNTDNFHAMNYNLKVIAATIKIIVELSFIVVYVNKGLIRAFQQFH